MIWMVATGVVIVIVWFLRYVKKKAIALEESCQRRFAGIDIRLLDKTAIYHAQKSDGYSHSRGMGYLVLTDSELYFQRQLGNKVIAIPIGSILAVGQTYKLAGQSSIRATLKVEFTNNLGQQDAIAVRVKELEQWETEISAMLQHNA